MSNELETEAVCAHLRSALESMVYQYGLREDGPVISTGGMSALEEAFEALEWADPHPVPELKCDEPGCTKCMSCGWPATDGRYRQTCFDHMQREA